MSQIVLLLRMIATLILVTNGIDNIREPLIWKFGLGIVELMLAIAFIYKPFTSLFKKR